jgi:hypothetical protein
MEMDERTFWGAFRILCFSAIMIIASTFILPVCHATEMPGRDTNIDPIIEDNPQPAKGLPIDAATVIIPPVPVNTPKMSTGEQPVERTGRQRVDWMGILQQSATFLAVEQGYRIVTQPGTREALKGEFFDDWFDSVKATRGWGDADDFLTNYIGHPMEGAVTGYIFVQNDPRGKKEVFGRNSSYWSSRFKALAWTTFYSTQFELGPVSEASIGNVGTFGGSLSGAVDLVVTPLAGFGWQVGEDALDKYLIVKIESWTTNPVVLMLTRSFLNPTRSFANVMRMNVPWHRDTRPGIWSKSRENKLVRQMGKTSQTNKQ